MVLGAWFTVVLVSDGDVWYFFCLRLVNSVGLLVVVCVSLVDGLDIGLFGWRIVLVAVRVVLVGC